MKTTDILERMMNGAVLCCGYHEFEKVWWLHPGSHGLIRRDVAEQIIKLPGIEPSTDSLIEGALPQTWKVAKGVKVDRPKRRRKRP